MEESKSEWSRVILVTGSGTGIGRFVAEYFAKRNCLVYAGVRREEDVTALDAIANIRGIKLDVTQMSDIQMGYRTIKEQTGQLDVLINNAGIPGWGALMDRDIEYIQRIMNVNLYGAVRMNKAFYPLLQKSIRIPLIINISSQGGKYSFPFWGPYHMSKFALEAYSDALRREMNIVGIRVVVIQPGAIISDAFVKQKEQLEVYEQEIQSVFTPFASSLLGMAFRAKDRKVKSPLKVAQDIERAIYSSRPKLRYQPGRRLFPDIVASKVPQRLVDTFFNRFFRSFRKPS